MAPLPPLSLHLAHVLGEGAAVSDALLVFASTFIAVFFLGLQSLNVNQGHRLAATVTSFFISLGHLALYRHMPTGGPLEIAGYFAGGIAGINAAMSFHPQFKAWWAARTLARRGPPRPMPTPAPRPKQTAAPACICGAGIGEDCPRLVCERYGDEHADVNSPRLH